LRVSKRPEPIGLHLNRTARRVSRAFDAALAEAGGSLPLWLVLLALKRGQHTAQRELAEAIGIEGATLTHHLNRMEEEGLIVRRRAPDNRRVQHVSLTDTGEEKFRKLLTRVTAFDRQLRAGVSEEALAGLRAVLEQLEHNATPQRTAEEEGTS
jgi:MarR family transcriptional regulator for hemolysin